MAIGGGRNISGLLGSDFNDPRTQGVLGLATGLLAAGGPSVGRPISLGQALGTGLQGGMDAFQKAQQRADLLNRYQDTLDYRSRQEKRQNLLDERQFNRQNRLDERQLRLDEENRIRQQRLDDIAERRGQYQVVGGNLFDMSGDQPKLVELPSKLSEEASADGRLIYTTNADGTVSVRKSSLFDELEKAAAANKAPKALSTKAQSAEDEDFYAIDTSQGILTDIDHFTDLIDNDKLGFGFVEGIGDSTARFLNIAGEEAINSAQFDTFLEKLRNDSLRLNKGVQTEGDAKRALNELIKNKNDTKVIRAQLQRLREINERAVEIRKRNINRRRKSQNIDAFDFSDYSTPNTGSNVGFKIK